jgi:hypothetical protein
LPQAPDFLNHPTFRRIGSGEVTLGIFHDRQEMADTLLQLRVALKGLHQCFVGLLKHDQGCLGAERGKTQV